MKNQNSVQKEKLILMKKIDDELKFLIDLERDDQKEFIFNYMNNLAKMTVADLISELNKIKSGKI